MPEDDAFADAIGDLTADQLRDRFLSDVFDLTVKEKRLLVTLLLGLLDLPSNMTRETRQQFMVIVAKLAVPVLDAEDRKNGERS